MLFHFFNAEIIPQKSLKIVPVCFTPVGYQKF